LITLSLPPRKVPCELDKEKYKCDEVMIKKLKDIEVEEEPKEENPMWAELNKIKFNKN
jgi:hypothetical protein